MKKLEAISNFAVLAVALLSCYILIAHAIIPMHSKTRGLTADAQFNAEPLKGTTLKLKDLQLSKSKPSLVLAISSYCHFCADSASFYQQLTAMRDQQSIKAQIIAVFPRDVQPSNEFLERNKIKPDSTIIAPLESIGVAGTPTLLLIGKDGTVHREWIGRLSQSQEDEVIHELRN